MSALVPAAGVKAAGIPNDSGAVLHALNRLTFGPRADEVERVRRTGLAEWIDAQLNPARIDDATLERRLPRPPIDAPRFDSPAAFAKAPAARMEARRAARDAVGDLASVKLLRAAYSERQLEEVLVDFWFNHFNVFAGKGRTAIYLPDYEREAIRPFVLGRFRDLLGATAHHPAMLFYLDNWMSVDPDAAARQTQRRPNAAAQPRRPGLAPQGRPGLVLQTRRKGLNENYGRELLELHTLGVDGGYTQKDVIEVARAFTGWTIAPGTNEFRFARAMHDDGAKVVLGQTIKAGGGIEDGERVLDIVARHPSTAHHIAFELAQRFVSDEPPESLVTRAATRFKETDGDLREVVRTIVTSPEFFAAEARNAKVKTPLEFVVSAVRATGSDEPNMQPMVRGLRELGMPLYGCQPPTGYDDTAATWISSGSLVARINLAQQLAGDKADIVSAPEFQRR